jgi:hypothetical protein
MDAVRTFLEDQGASVRIALAEAAPGAPLDYAPFEFVIDIPHAAYTHGA